MSNKNAPGSVWIVEHWVDVDICDLIAHRKKWNSVYGEPVEYIPASALEEAAAHRHGMELELERLRKEVASARVDMLIKAQNIVMNERQDIAPSVYQHLYSLFAAYIEAESAVLYAKPSSPPEPKNGGTDEI